MGGAVDAGYGGGFGRTGSLFSLGGRAHLTFGRSWQVSAGAAYVHAAEDELNGGVSAHGTVALRLREARPTLAMNVQTGIAWTRHAGASGGSIRMLDVPVSWGNSIFAPSPVGPAELWVAPRLHLRRVESSIAGMEVQDTRVGAGASAGLNFTHAATQLGFAVSGDLLVMEDPAESKTRATFAAGLTVHLLRLR